MWFKNYDKNSDVIRFQRIKEIGSHKFFINYIGLTTVIPVHYEDLTRGLIRKILKDINITIDEYEKLKNQFDYIKPLLQIF